MKIGIYHNSGNNQPNKIVRKAFKSRV